MVNISYHRLFNLKISHNYYIDGLAKGIRLIPSKQTELFLKNSRMLFKRLNDKNVVLFRTADENPPVDPPNPLIALQEDFRLNFAITVEDLSSFINKTDLDISPTNQYQSSNILYFNNDPASASDLPNAPESLNYTLLDGIRNSLFSYAFQIVPAPAPAPPPLTFVDLYVFSINDDGTLGTEVSIGKDVNGVPFSSPRKLPIDQAGIGKYSHVIDLRSKKSGRYRIIVVDDGDNPLLPGDILRQETVYVDDALASQSILGIVDIRYEAPSTIGNAVYKTPEEYVVEFSRKKTIWKYFVVNKNSTLDLNTYSITTPVAAQTGTPYVQNTFNPVADVTINGKPTKVFESDFEIDFFEIPKLNVKLEGNAGDPTIDHLPNASPNNNVKKNTATSVLESEIYVFL